MANHRTFEMHEMGGPLKESTWKGVRHDLPDLSFHSAPGQLRNGLPVTSPFSHLTFRTLRHLGRRYADLAYLAK